MKSQLILKSVQLFSDAIQKAPGSDRVKSIVLSSTVFLLLLLLLFFIRFWPPSNIAELVGGGGGGGVTVNFGNTDFGSGKQFESKELDVKKTSKQIVSLKTPDENIITSEKSNDDVVVIPKSENKKKSIIADPKKEVRLVEVKKVVVKKTDDALSNLLKGNNKGGDGNSKSTGNQGRSNGDINATGYSGTGGSGGGNGSGNGIGSGSGSGSGSGGGSGNGSGIGNGSGYSLGNRKALSKPQPNYTCNEEGKVVVEISVDRNGKVTNATPGIKGTTNTASCLLSQAKIAALNTKWESSTDAPEKQVGKIIYNFSLN